MNLRVAIDLSQYSERQLWNIVRKAVAEIRARADTGAETEEERRELSARREPKRELELHSA